jgi:hypothetical protein
MSTTELRRRDREIIQAAIYNAGERLQPIEINFRPHNPRGCMSIIVFVLAMGRKT